MANPFLIPNTRQRLTIMGHTGCGKTQLANWVLSESAFDRIPYYVIDYKRDDFINQIPYRHEIGYNEWPKQPGVYVLHPRVDQNEHVEKWLWGVYEKGNAGVFVDEAFNMPKQGAYQALLTQGRSKQIPMINLTQKPRYVPMHVFSEADFHSVFHLSDKKDWQRVNEFMPVDPDTQLPEYHSWWYDVKRRARFVLRPVPDADSLLETFSARLKPKRRVL